MAMFLLLQKMRHEYNHNNSNMHFEIVCMKERKISNNMLVLNDK